MSDVISEIFPVTFVFSSAEAVRTSGIIVFTVSVSVFPPLFIAIYVKSEISTLLSPLRSYLASEEPFSIADIKVSESLSFTVPSPFISPIAIIPFWFSDNDEL